MDDVGTATLSDDGDAQVVHLPEGFRLPAGELRVTRVGDGLLLRPAATDAFDAVAWRAKLDAFDVDEWWAKLDAYQDIPFMEGGRQQPPMPDGSDISLD